MCKPKNERVNSFGGSKSYNYSPKVVHTLHYHFFTLELFHPYFFSLSRKVNSIYSLPHSSAMHTHESIRAGPEREKNFLSMNFSAQRLQMRVGVCAKEKEKKKRERQKEKYVNMSSENMVGRRQGAGIKFQYLYVTLEITVLQVHL